MRSARLCILRLVMTAVLAIGSSPASRASQAVPQSHPPCATCIVLSLGADQLEMLPGDLAGLQVFVEVDAGADIRRVLDAIVARHGTPGVVLQGLPQDSIVRALTGVSAILLDLRGSLIPSHALLFDLRTRLTQLRAAARGPLQLIVEPSAAVAAALQEQPPAGYWDALVLSGDAPRDSVVWRRGGNLDNVAAALDATRQGTADRWIFRAPETRDAAVRAIADLASAARLLTSGLVSSSETRVLCDGRSGEVYLNPSTLDRVSFFERCPDAARVTVEPQAAFERIQLGSGEALVRWSDQAVGRFATDARVSASRRLTAEEIVARHQAAAEKQAAAISTLISAGTLTVTFEAPGFPAPVTVTSETTIFRDATRTELEQQDIRVNGIAFGSQRVPRLPIIEAERVSAPPLTITLGDKYRYRLAGEDTIGGVRTYIVGFEPHSTNEPLFRGRAWIAADDFGMVKVEASETGLRGPVVSSEQSDQFTRTPAGAWVLERSDIHQLYQGAAYRTPIHRVLALSVQEANAPDFEARRQAAYASAHTILRDTPAGYRYLEGEARHKAAAGSPNTTDASAASGSGRATRVRTFAFGVIVDPNISRPLPFAGLSYLDFDLFGTGAQFNGFFGGTYGQLAFSVPSLGRSRWQLAGQAYGIASSYNDRDFDAGREQYDRNVTQRPAFGAVWALHPLTPRVNFRTGYELEYTHFARSQVTAPDFEAPADQVAHGVRAALEGQRSGWEWTLWWLGVRRSGWRAWGRQGTAEYQPSQRDFQRYGASVARSFVFSPGLVGRAEASVVGGHDLDRFSRYSFGAFDNRLHGYPAALIRYDRGATLRSTLAWSARVVRVDGFADAAIVRDTGFARGASRFAGIGAAVEAPAPFGTLVAAEWGYGFQGINADGRRGTHVVRITGYKVF